MSWFYLNPGIFQAKRYLNIHQMIQDPRSQWMSPPGLASRARTAAAATRK